MHLGIQACSIEVMDNTIYFITVPFQPPSWGFATNKVLLLVDRKLRDISISEDQRLRYSNTPKETVVPEAQQRVGTGNHLTRHPQSDNRRPRRQESSEM